MEISFAQIEKFKEQGNNFFRAKKLQEAKEEFAKGIELLEKQKELSEEFQQIYLQLLTNISLVELSFKHYESVVSYCTKAISIDKKNIKAFYRRAQANIGAAENLNISDYSNQKLFLNAQLEMYEKAKNDLEEVIMGDPNNQQIKDMFKDAFKKYKNLQNALGIKEEDTKKMVKKQKEPTQPVQNNDVVKVATKEQKDKNAGVTKSLKTEYLQQVAQAAMKNVIDELIESNELPPTATIFEKNVSAFKSNISMLFYYIKKISKEHLLKIYSKKDIPLDTLCKIIETIQLTGITIDKQFCIQFMIALTQTYQFDLLNMMLSKKDLAQIWAILDSFDQVEQKSEVEQLKKIFKHQG